MRRPTTASPDSDYRLRPKGLRSFRPPPRRLPIPAGLPPPRPPTNVRKDGCLGRSGPRSDAKPPHEVPQRCIPKRPKQSTHLSPKRGIIRSAAALRTQTARRPLIFAGFRFGHVVQRHQDALFLPMAPQRLGIFGAEQRRDHGLRGRLRLRGLRRRRLMLRRRPRFRRGLSVRQRDRFRTGCRPGFRSGCRIGNLPFFRTMRRFGSLTGIHGGSYAPGGFGFGARTRPSRRLMRRSGSRSESRSGSLCFGPDLRAGDDRTCRFGDGFRRSLLPFRLGVVRRNGPVVLPGGGNGQRLRLFRHLQFDRKHLVQIDAHGLFGRHGDGIRRCGCCGRTARKFLIEPPQFFERQIAFDGGNQARLRPPFGHRRELSEHGLYIIWYHNAYAFALKDTKNQAQNRILFVFAGTEYLRRIKDTKKIGCENK